MNPSGENQSYPRRKLLSHKTPHWVRESEAIFFITVCCAKRGDNQLATPAVAAALIDSVRHRNETTAWWCSAFVVMPDHIHGLIQFSHPMEQTMRNWKAWTAKEHGISWQPRWFDHRLRNDENWHKKAEYLFNNPLRAGLVREGDDWPWTFFCER